MATAIWGMSSLMARPIEVGCAIASLRFIPRDDMEAEGYGDYLDQVEDIR